MYYSKQSWTGKIGVTSYEFVWLLKLSHRVPSTCTWICAYFQIQCLHAVQEVAVSLQISPISFVGIYSPIVLHVLVYETISIPFYIQKLGKLSTFMNTFHIYYLLLCECMKTEINWAVILFRKNLILLIQFSKFDGRRID